MVILIKINLSNQMTDHKLFIQTIQKEIPIDDFEI